MLKAPDRRSGAAGDMARSLVQGGRVPRSWVAQVRVPWRSSPKFGFFGFSDFLDPALVLEVSDMALLIPEVWDFYLLLNATFFFSIIFRFFIDFSLLSSPRYSLSSPGAPPDRKKKIDFFIKN